MHHLPELAGLVERAAPPRAPAICAAAMPPALEAAPIALGAPALIEFIEMDTASCVAQLSNHASLVVQAPGGGACTILNVAAAGHTHTHSTGRVD